jgi:hypothetical protein
MPGRGILHAEYVLAGDFIVIAKVSMLMPGVTNRISMTLQSISPQEEMDFGGRTSLFAGDLLQMPPIVPKFAMPVVYCLTIRLPD